MDMMSSTVPSHFDPNGGVLEEFQILPPKLTTIDLIGGIFCHICNSTYINKKEYDSHYAQHNTDSADIVYTCVVCKKQITGYPSFRGHCYLKHVTKDKFKCKHCFKSYSKQSALNSHIDTLHKYKCTSCNKEFPSKNELQVHQIIHKNENDKPPYPCNTCGKNIDSVDMCELHIDDHCIILYPCPICNESLRDKLDAAKHLTKHFGEAVTDNMPSDVPFASEDSSIDVVGGIHCSYCSTLFKNRSEFDMHFTADHPDKTIIYSCNICGKQYEKYGLFGNHCYFHITKNKFQCDQCNKTFPRLSLLVIHTEAFHSAGAADKPFKCDMCGHSFKSSKRFREHLRDAHDIEYIKCPEEGCEDTFETPKDLILHQKKHKATRQALENWCRQCGLQFTTLASCEKHLHVHKKKLYSCPICSKEYREKYLMVKHIPQHFETVLHVCKVCGKSYNARNRLIQHTKIHSDVRSHKCTYCSKSFFKPHELKQHLNIHTGFKPYKCTVCPKTFANYPNWIKHTRKVHKIDAKSIPKPKITEEPKTIANESKVSMNNLQANVESGIDSTSSEMSVDLYNFIDSDDSLLDSVDTSKEWEILNGNSHSINGHVNSINGDFNHVNSIGNSVVGHIDSMGGDLNSLAVHEMSGNINSLPGPADSLGNNINSVAGHVDSMGSHINSIVVHEMGSNINSIVSHVDSMGGNFNNIAIHTMNGDINSINGHIDSMRHNINSIGQVESVGNNINHISAHEMNGNINSITNHIDSMDGNLNSITGHVDSMAGNINSISGHVDSMNGEISSIAIHGMSGEINTVGHVNSMDANINSITSHVDTMNGEINSISCHVDSICGNANSTASHVDSMNSDVTIIADLVESMNDNILEYANMMPVNNLTFTPGVSEHTAVAEAMQHFEALGYPPQYGPEFINRGIQMSSHTGEFIDLDDHIMPHIDPLLTINNENTKIDVHSLQNIINMDGNVGTNSFDMQTNWEPPIITKFCQTYEDLNDVNRLSVLNTDIF